MRRERRGLLTSAPCWLPGGGFPGNPGAENNREWVSTLAAREKRKRALRDAKEEGGSHQHPVPEMLSNAQQLDQHCLLPSSPDSAHPERSWPRPGWCGGSPSLPPSLPCPVSLGFCLQPHQPGEAGRPGPGLFPAELQVRVRSGQGVNPTAVLLCHLLGNGSDNLERQLKYLLLYPAFSFSLVACFSCSYSCWKPFGAGTG